MGISTKLFKKEKEKKRIWPKNFICLEDTAQTNHLSTDQGTHFILMKKDFYTEMRLNFIRRRRKPPIDISNLNRSSCRVRKVRCPKKFLHGGEFCYLPTRPRAMASVPRNMKSLQCSMLAITPFPLKCFFTEAVKAL